MIISIISLGIVVWLIEPASFIEAVKKADYRMVLAGSGVTLVWLVVRGLAWRTLLQKKAGLVDVFFTLCEGYLVNNILPFRLGEVARTYLLGRKAKIEFWQVLPTVIIERALDVAFGVGLFLGTLPFVVGADWAVKAAVGTAILITTSLVILYAIARFRKQTEKLLQYTYNRWSFIERLVSNRAPAFLDGLSILASPSLFITSLMLLGLNWLLGILQFYFYVRAFYPEGNFLWAAFCLGALALGVSAPSSPGSLGVYELVLVSALSIFVDNPSQSGALALTAHAIQYIVTGIPGGIALFRDGETLSSLYQRVQNIRKPA